MTTRPYPIRMWAEAHVRGALNRLPDTAGVLSVDDHMMASSSWAGPWRSKEVYLGAQVQTGTVMDWPSSGRYDPAAGVPGFGLNGGGVQARATAA